MYRVVPDVRALIQAAISSTGPAALLIASWEQGDSSLITCEQIMADYASVLRRPHIIGKFRHITPQRVATSVTALRSHAILVTLTDIPRVVPEDPDDDVVVACAVLGSADYIVSRDRHLLRLGAHQGIPVVSTEAFARILRGQVSEPLELVCGRPG
ncbi:MAG TPA: PIN domain-containing protein [bacterium]|nr:PIN domain-containing protein [bacterium]